MKINKFVKFAFSFLFILAGFLNVSACGRSLSVSEIPGQSDLVADLEISDTAPVQGPVTLEFSLTNRSDTALYFLRWYTPLEGIAGEIFQIERDGQPIPYEGILAMRAAPTPEAYIYLQPGESVTTEVDLSSAYNFSQPGKYSIAFLSPKISHIAYSKTEMAKSVDALHLVDISSNEVSVEIVEHSANKPSFTLSSEQALAMIEDHLWGQRPDLTEASDLEIEELSPENIQKSLQAQIFKVTGGEAFLNEMFLISEGQVLRLGNAEGGRGITSMLLSDMDQDGVEELVFTFSFNSGTYQSRIGVYAPEYSKMQFFETSVVYLGDLGLTIQEDGVVNVRIVEADAVNLRLKYLATLGDLTLRGDETGPMLIFELADNLSEEVKSKLITGQVTSECQLLDRVQIDVDSAGDLSLEELAAALWTRYLERFQSALVPNKCRLLSFTVNNVIIDPKEGEHISAGTDVYIALIEYAVQVEHQEETIWMAGSGSDTTYRDDGWIGKTGLAKVSRKDNVYILTIQGFG